MNILYFIAFNLIIYSFVGWIIEELYCLVVNRKFKKDGFLRGPIKPMYGIAMCTLVLCYYVLNIRGITMAILCFLIPTAVEYVSGYLMKLLFNKTYWNYGGNRFNLNGHICLKFSLYWMILSVIGILFFQPILNNIYIEMNSVYLKIFIVLMSVLGIIDFISVIGEYYFKSYIKV